eukprot:scaffold1595_cov171-Amphora_coffeaeformis.AAC.11
MEVYPPKKTRRLSMATTTPEVLTVGDGDLSLSLALARAYGPQISLTASTIVSNKQDLLRLYPHAGPIVQELGEERRVPIQWGVDATKLHETWFRQRAHRDDDDDASQQQSIVMFDLILFYHPHLGIVKDASVNAEAEQARRHECLLAHYLASAATRLKPAGKAHLCLCGTQPETWNVRKTAQRLQLSEIQPGKSTTAAPWHLVMQVPHLEACAPREGFAAPRKYRNGKQGSRHWLGKYGYCHRRTQGDLYDGLAADTNVEWSVDLLFQPTENVVKPITQPILKGEKVVCPICLVESPSMEAHRRHLDAPALPCDVELVKSDTMDEKIMETAPTGNEERSGVRLRKYVQKHFGRTKAAASQLIHAGNVFVNGEAVTDSARWVYNESTEVELKDYKQQNIISPPIPSIPIQTIARLDGPIHIVWKPVGLRTKGQFPGTLENLVALQWGEAKMESLTRLDTGLSGLCLLYEASSDPPAPVRHRFTGLVLGRMASSLGNSLELVLNTEQHRRWGKGIASLNERNEMEEESAHIVDLRVTEISSIVGHKDGEDEVLTLSTIQIDVAENLSGIGSLLTYALRKQLDLRVVGDRFSNKEYVKLPRSIRNRIKQKICLGCSAISYDGKEYEYPIPDKWKAGYWATFLQNADTPASSRDRTTL